MARAITPDRQRWATLGKEGHDVVFKSLVTTETGGPEDLMLGIGKLPPGGRHLPHRHAEEREFFYVLSGESDFSIGTATYHVAKGTLLVAEPGEAHSIRNTGEADFDFLYGFNHGSLEALSLIWVTEAEMQLGAAPGCEVE